MPVVRFFKDIFKTFRRIFADIGQLKNLDNYLVTGLAILFAVLGLVGDSISDDLKMSIILAALGILVFSLTKPEQEVKTLDTFLNDRTALPKLSDSLQTTEELWIYAPSAANILRGDSLGIIKQNILDNPKGHLRVLLQNPHEKIAVDMLVEHLDKGVIEQNNQSMPEEISNTVRQLNALQNRENKGKLSYGILRYGLGFSVIIFNPNKATGYVILEIHGFLNQDTRSRMHIRIERSESEYWFNYWLTQMRDMWDSASDKYENRS